MLICQRASSQLLGWPIPVSSEHTVGAQKCFLHEHTVSLINKRTLHCWEGRSELRSLRWTGRLANPGVVEKGLWQSVFSLTPPAAAEHWHVCMWGAGAHLCAGAGATWLGTVSSSWQQRLTSPGASTSRSCSLEGPGPWGRSSAQRKESALGSGSWGAVLGVARD